ncbi:circular bacteriocin, circularin A/uberolysin family [Bacillus safensis]|nr:circular bacteriocin, circularin A/uberolysin family [Bacillus safensis]
MGATASVIIGILSGFLTGGLGLIANAGRQALTVYLKEELRKRGKKAFIAW